MTVDPLAQAVMVAYCGWDPTLLVANETATLDGNGTPVITLPSLHVTAVTQVTVTDHAGTLHTYQSTDTPATIGPGPTNVAWSENGVLTCKDPTLGRVWPQDDGNITVTYNGGYSITPDDLQAALDHLTARVPQMTGATTRKLGSATITVAQQIANGGLLLIEQMVLDRYRLPRAA